LSKETKQDSTNLSDKANGAQKNYPIKIVKP